MGALAKNSTSSVQQDKAPSMSPEENTSRKCITRCRCVLSTIFFSAGVRPDSRLRFRFHCGPNCAAFNRQKIPGPLRPLVSICCRNIEKGSQSQDVFAATFRGNVGGAPI